MTQEYELIIIGGGPAGLTAGIYAARARLNTLLIERGLCGGQIVDAELVENFPGFPHGIHGGELGQSVYEQAMKFGLRVVNTEVSALNLKERQNIVNTSEGTFAAKAVIIASGCERRKLGVPREAALTGRGVSYCATCDAPFFKNKAVACVGGGDRALSEALHLTKFASKVSVIHRRDQFRAARIVQEKTQADPKIEFILNSVVEGLEGKDVLEGLKLRDTVTGKESDLKVAGVFVCIGLKPNTEYLKGSLSLDEQGYIITNDRMGTDIPGVFAAGDIRHNSPQQAITAAGDGATAAIYAQRFLGE
ncbi:MAG: thioredoxin-disulfide reductase [Chloroflexi bacterium]|nr:thioredoxin-disulfide reductase [Chloroflexota bacterium]